MVRNPRRGLCVPDNLPHDEVLAVANPYLGPCPSVQTDWTPLKHRVELFEKYGRPLPPPDDVWQFDTFRVWQGCYMVSTNVERIWRVPGYRMVWAKHRM